MAEPKLTIPHAIGWSVLSSVFVFVATAIWVGRGAYAELQAVREAAAALADEQRSTNFRVNAVENKMSAYDERFTYIIDALRRQEARSGYVPPPAPQ